MKKLYKYCVAVAALALTATSCANFLEEDPKGKMVAENFFKSGNDLTLALNALYSQVQQSQRHSNPYIIQLQGDDITINTSTKEAYLSADAFKDPSDTKGARDLWAFRYQVIQAANLIIDNAENADEATQEEINIALGNALFWRAYSYFELVRVFGPLPVNEHNLPDNNSTPMTGVEDLYKMIMGDLERANALNLPATYKGQKYGFTDKCNYWVTSAAVKATLAAVYMNRGGWPFYEKGQYGTEWYGKAADLLKEVYDGVNNGTYALELEQDYGQVYSYGNNWSAEQLLTVGYMNIPGNMNVYTSQFSKCQTPEQFKSGWIDFMGEYKWWAEYPEGPRKHAVYEDVINTETLKNSAADALSAYCCVSWWSTEDEQPVTSSRSNARLKIYHPTFASMQVNADEDQHPIEAPYDCRKSVYQGQSVPQNHRLIRYSEVLCWFAECAARAGKHEAEAKAGLQQVLDRAYGPGVKTVDADMAEQAVLEHGYEVTGYPLALVTRRADLFRLDRLQDVWAYRHGPQTTVIVPAGAATTSYKKQGRTKYEEYNYSNPADIILQEDNQVAETWRGYESMYYVYPPTEVIKNPNIKRVSAMN
ncbi:MAG: RagB/SusD family nutrient uptake outer membrane protein [Muribaculaceae bacterium]|nr:RagB/SusD family nutrient uptake outer membrane protein [Muribaculaceae bacterium]